MAIITKPLDNLTSYLFLSSLISGCCWVRSLKNFNFKTGKKKNKSKQILFSVGRKEFSISGPQLKRSKDSCPCSHFHPNSQFFNHIFKSPHHQLTTKAISISPIQPLCPDNPPSLFCYNTSTSKAETHHCCWPTPPTSHAHTSLPQPPAPTRWYHPITILHHGAIQSPYWNSIYPFKK